MTNATIQNLRSKYGDAALLNWYAIAIKWQRAPMSHSGPIRSMSYRDLAGRAVAEERGMSDDEVLAFTGRA